MNSFESLNPCHVEYSENNLISLKANPNTDFFCKYRLSEIDSAAFFFKEFTGDFTVKARVTTSGEHFGDAAMLMVRESSNRWIKLCVEMGSDKKYSVVSVVTDSWSDDANGELVPGNEAWLRIARINNFFGLHFSLDGQIWRFVRAFGLDLGDKVKVGFGIQAPRSQHCTGTIDKFEISDRVISDFRSGE